MDQQIRQAADDLSRLNQQFDLSMKNNNISQDDLKKVMSDFEQGKLPKDISVAFQDARDLAKRTGQELAEHSKQGTTSATTAKASGNARRGMMRI